MKYCLYALFLVLLCSCGDSQQSTGKKSADGTEVNADLPKDSQQILDALSKYAAAGEDSLFVDNLREFRRVMSVYINDSKLIEANDLRVAVQNFLEQSVDVAKLAGRNPLLLGEVNATLNLPEIKEQTLPSIAASLNVAGVIVEERTVRRIEEAQAESNSEDGHREDVIQPEIESDLSPNPNDANT